MMTKRLWTTALAITIASSACAKKATDVEDVPVGSDVVLTRADGGVVEGKLAEKDAAQVKVNAGRVTRTVRRDQIADVRLIDRTKPEVPLDLPPVARFREYTIPGGTRLALELDQPVNSETSKVGDEITAKLDESVVIDEITVLPVGTKVYGSVTEVSPAGKVKGRAHLAMRFTRVAAGGENYAIAAPFAMTAPSGKNEDAQKIVLPAAGGAVIGAILGGKKGAAVGAAVGGGAGTAHVLMTEGKDVGLRDGAVIGVTLGQPLDVKINIR